MALNEVSEYHSEGWISLPLSFYNMKVEQRVITYQISYSQGKNVQKTSVIDVAGDDEIKSLIISTFRERFKKPEKLSYKDGVRIAVKRLNHVEHTVESVLTRMVYNKSVRQVRIELEKAINAANY